MERRTFIETFGLLTKLERVVSINQHKDPNTLILEIAQPYPGYYSSHDADTSKPRTMFLVTKERYSMKEALKLNLSAKNFLDYSNLEISPCIISIYAESYTGFRVRYLRDFKMVADIQSFMKSEGVTFQRYKPLNDTATIEIQKLYSLEEVVEGVYQDLDEVGERYIALSVPLTFSQFVKVTQAVKNNIEENNFDAALSLFYRKRGIEYAVRIFEPYISVHNLELIKKAYGDQIKRLKLNEL